MVEMYSDQIRNANNQSRDDPAECREVFQRRHMCLYRTDCSKEVLLTKVVHLVEYRVAVRSMSYECTNSS
jgi:hypothetical protein